jgi:hypothetical protein
MWQKIVDEFAQKKFLTFDRNSEQDASSVGEQLASKMNYQLKQKPWVISGTLHLLFLLSLAKKSSHNLIYSKLIKRKGGAGRSLTR